VTKLTTGETLSTIAREIDTCLRNVDIEQVDAALDEIQSAPRVFLAGMGRSALAIRGFAMRLMHFGKATFVLGEIVTPGIAAGDLLIIGSGSGRTESLVANANKAKNLGARILLFTIDAQSPLAQLADQIVVIPAPSPKVVGEGKQTSVQPMGSLFEQGLLVLCDACVLRLMQESGTNAEQMFARHANLE
jgi:6-phospho-3-hexuloisomerase